MAACLLLPASPAFSRAGTTVPQTIQDRDRDNRLEPAPGEDHEPREDLGVTASEDRARTREALLFFGQLTDKHLVDEESPARVEFLDRFGPPFTSAYRPQEGLSAQVVEAMVRQLKNVRSPVTQEELELVMTTGDNSDNTQLNETRWFIDLLDGDKVVDPNSGVDGQCGEEDNGLLYDGVRNQNEYYEPDSSEPDEEGNTVEDGPGYSPNQAENMAEAQRSNEVRDWPGLFERMNEPFRADGLDVPWYGIFGNHDGLVQGNQPRNELLNQIATGCVKPSKLSGQALADIVALAEDEDGITPDDAAAIQQIAFDYIAGESGPLVPKDDRRRLLKKSEYMHEHTLTTGSPPGHGFNMRPAQAVLTDMGYYSFHPKPGIRFIVLDTISELGGDGGNLDDNQFDWLDQELEAADNTPGEIAVVFGHHSLQTMEQLVSPFPPGDQGGDSTPPLHLGGHDETEDCPAEGSPPNPLSPETVRCLLLRHESVVAFVNGHEHNNRIDSFERPGGGGGFWEINTASHIDWPQQSRVFDLVDNHDGTLSIFTTMIDHDSAPQPGEGQGDAVKRLASTSRELSYNDPDAQNGEDRSSDARGSPADRNVELLVNRP